MAWGTRKASSVLAGAEARELGLSIFDTAIATKEAAFSVTCDLQSTSSATLVSVFSWRVRIPEYARGGDELRFAFRLGHSLSGKAVAGRIVETGGPTNGTTQTFTTTAAGETALVESVITIPDDSWASTTKTLSLELRSDDGSANAIGGAFDIAGNVRIREV